jgi:hypothetical protein
MDLTAIATKKKLPRQAGGVFRFQETGKDIMESSTTSPQRMTYRQIKEYSEGEGWDFSAGGFECDLAKRGRAPRSYDDGPPPWPWGVDRWLDHEVLPTIRRQGNYEWPDNLDITCEFTVLQTGRYVTEPRDDTRLTFAARVVIQ